MKSKNYPQKAFIALLAFWLLILPVQAQELGMKGGISYKEDLISSQERVISYTDSFLESKNPFTIHLEQAQKSINNQDSSTFIAHRSVRRNLGNAIDYRRKLMLNVGGSTPNFKEINDNFDSLVSILYTSINHRDYVDFTTKYEKGPVFFPARSSFQNKLIHGDIDKSNGSPVTFLNNGGINFTGKGESTTMSFFSELAAGYFGPFRVSLSMGNTETGTVQLDSAQISSYSDQQLDSLFKEINKASSSAKTIQNLLTSGGNGSLKVSVPFLWWKIGRMKFSKENKETEQMVIASNFFTRVSTMFPAFNRQIENPQFATELGLEAVTAINFAATGDEKISALRFLGKFKAGGLFGSRYITSMGMDGSKAAFEFKAELGFAISDALMISFNYMNIRQSSAVKTKISTIGLSFLNF